jgi:hypothetical protein
MCGASSLLRGTKKGEWSAAEAKAVSAVTTPPLATVSAPLVAAVTLTGAARRAEKTRASGPFGEAAPFRLAHAFERTCVGHLHRSTKAGERAS